MAQYAAKATLFLLPPDQKAEKAPRNAGSGKSPQAPGATQRLTRRSSQIHLARSWIGAKGRVSLGLGCRCLGAHTLAEKAIEEGLGI
jgi:hypothetical protein